MLRVELELDVFTLRSYNVICIPEKLLWHPNGDQLKVLVFVPGVAVHAMPFILLDDSYRIIIIIVNN